MRISGFTLCRNAESLYYPIRESILSALPLVDEFVIAFGAGEKHDKTLELIESINSYKIKVIRTEWDLEKYPRGSVHAQQTDLAKSHCTGDWLIYLQADEVIHEEDYATIKSACTDYLEQPKVDGFLFQYLHFWGDYQHCQNSHAWYNKEIRIVRNDSNIHSWQSAQSFRWIENFDGISYHQKKGTSKLKVVQIDAKIYHYGWVRPPKLMTKKMNELDKIHSHSHVRFGEDMYYGDLKNFPLFKGTHPSVMNERIALFNWSGELKKKRKATMKGPHESFSARALTWIETHVLRGRQIFSFKNYIRVG